MSNTIPQVFEGPISVNPVKIAVLTDWYVSSLGDSDHSSDIEDAMYWLGASDAYSDALTLLHDKIETAVEAVKKNPHLITRKRVIIAIAVYAAYKNRKTITAGVEYAAEAVGEFAVDVWHHGKHAMSTEEYRAWKHDQLKAKDKDESE